MQDNIKSKLKIVVIVLLFAIIIGYAFFRTKDLLFGVKLKIYDLKDYQSFEEPVITINGNAKRATELLINGRKIFITKEGSFTEKLLLLPGYNIIDIKATDRFGKSEEEVFHLNLKEKSL